MEDAPERSGGSLFPDQLAVARNLQMQLEIRAARQSLVTALRGKPDISECARLVENYFDKLLAWNKETGWDKMININVWPQPIYEGGKDLTEAMAAFETGDCQRRSVHELRQSKCFLRRDQQRSFAKVRTGFRDGGLHRAVKTRRHSKSIAVLNSL